MQVSFWLSNAINSGSLLRHWRLWSCLLFAWLQANNVQECIGMYRTWDDPYWRVKLSNSRDLVSLVPNENKEKSIISSARIWRRLAASVCSKYLCATRWNLPCLAVGFFSPESLVESLRNGRLTGKLREGPAVGGPRPCLHKRLTHKTAWVRINWMSGKLVSLQEADHYAIMNLVTPWEEER